MTEAAARAILSVPPDQDSWAYIVEHPDLFLWSDNYELQFNFNEVAGRVAALPPLEHLGLEGQREILRYRGMVERVPLEFSRRDALICLHALARLVRADMDIRFCVDSCCSSDLAFLALPPSLWKSLEQEFSQAAVDFRFLGLREDFESFYTRALLGEARHYADGPEPPLSRELVFARAASAEVQALLDPAYPDITVSASTEGLAQSWWVFLGTVSDAERERLRADEASLLRIRPRLLQAGEELGLRFGGLRFGSLESFHREEHEHLLLYQCSLALEIPACWGPPTPLADGGAASDAAVSGAASAEVVRSGTVAMSSAPAQAASVSPQPQPRGCLAVVCTHCGQRFQAVPASTQMGYRQCRCTACGKTVQLGLTLMARAFYALMLLGMALLCVHLGEIDRELAIGMVCWAAVLAFDGYCLSRQRGGLEKA